MKNKIKVYLQYPWMFPDSPYYKNLINNPPEGIEYINIKKQKGVITRKGFFWFSNFLKKNIRKIVYMVYPTLANSHKSPNGDYDLIHCAHCLSKNKDKPWVADIEFVSQMWVAGKKPKNKNSVAKIIYSKNCKKLITWTKLMKKDLLGEFSEIKDKVEVVYPPIPILNIKRKKHSEINLFFVARYFFYKGGLHALEVIDRLTKKYSDVNGIIVSEVPKEIKNKYSKNKKIIFYSLMPQKDLFEKVYSVGDIFLYPGYSDSFGFSIPEVMSLGIPVVSFNTSTRNEIISHNKNGYLVETKLSQNELINNSFLISKENLGLISELEYFTEKLIINKKLRKDFSIKAKREISHGKFSVNKINKRLKKIYEGTLK